MLAALEPVEQIVLQAQQLSPEQRLRLIQRITDTLLPAVISSTQVDQGDSFENELAHFERLKPQLLEKYRNRFIALHQGKVVAVGEDKMAVLATAEAALGNVAFYVGQVTENGPRRVRMLSPRIVR